MGGWEYQKIDLNQYRPQGDDVDLLNAAGAEGWEAFAITSNNIAYLKRSLDETTPEPSQSGNVGASSGDAPASGSGSGDRAGRAHEVKPKYRDPRTNETWSGRGRMATWLKKKQDAGEDIEEYLVA